MKRYIAVLCTMLVLCLVMTACGKHENGEDSLEENGMMEESIRPESTSEDSQEAEEHLAEESVEAVAEATYPLYFEERESDYVEEEKYNPALELREDGSFTMVVNLLSHMSDLTGQYQVEGDLYYFTVEEINFRGFTGDDTKEFTMKQVDGNLEMQSEFFIGATDTASIFYGVPQKPLSFDSIPS